MQASTSSRMQAQRVVPGHRRAAAFRPATGSRQRTVQVLAKGKGKNKGMLRQSAGVSGQPGVPGLGGTAQMSMPRPEVPAVDPEFPEIVVFVRARGYYMGKIEMKDWADWMPLSIMKGNAVLKYLVEQMQNEWGRKLYGRTLIQSIGRGLYQEKEKIEAGIRSQFPAFANVSSKNFQYAFKIRDQSKPEEWRQANNITVLPPPEEVKATAIDTIKQFFSSENLGKMFSQS